MTEMGAEELDSIISEMRAGRASLERIESLLTPASDERKQLRRWLAGKTVPLSKLQTPIDVVNVERIGEERGEPEPVTLSFQLIDPLPANTTAKLTVLQMIGQGRFTRTIVPTQARRSIQLEASALYVSGQLVASVGAPANDVNISVALSRGSSNPLGNTFPTWVPRVGVVNKLASPVSGIGTLLGCQGHVNAVNVADGSQVWIGWYDSNVAPVDGVTVALLTMGPYAANQIVSFDRSLRQDVDFLTGLTWATTRNGSGIYAATNAGTTAGIDFDWGG